MRQSRAAPKYLAMYELEDHNVLRSSAYLDTVKIPALAATRQKAGTSRIGRNFLRNAYRQIFPVHTNPIEQTVEMAPFLQMGRIDVSCRDRRRIQRLVQHRLYSRLSGGAGLSRRAPFVAVEGQPKYLTVYEFEHARVSGERGLEPGPGQQPVDAAGAALFAP